MANERGGFTVVEAAVAIAVVAILSGILVPLVMKTLRDAKIAQARNDLHVICGALAAQLKDTGGRRPAVLPGNGPGGPNGVHPDSLTIWYSSPAMPWPFHGNDPTSLEALLANPDLALGNLLFGFGANHPRNAGPGYKGPYLSPQMARKTDPWGRAYFILGYNKSGQDTGGPIWVVSSGPGGRIRIANTITTPEGAYPSTWDYSGDSAGNIALKVQ